MELQLSTLSGWRLMRQKSLEQESGPVPQRDRAVSIVECSEKEALYILQSRCWCFRGRNSHVRLCPTILIVKKKKCQTLKMFHTLHQELLSRIHNIRFTPSQQRNHAAGGYKGYQHQ